MREFVDFFYFFLRNSNIFLSLWQNKRKKKNTFKVTRVQRRKGKALLSMFNSTMLPSSSRASTRATSAAAPFHPPREPSQISMKDSPSISHAASVAVSAEHPPSQLRPAQPCFERAKSSQAVCNGPRAHHLPTDTVSCHLRDHTANSIRESLHDSFLLAG